MLLSRWSADPAVVIDTVDESFWRLIALFDAPDQIQVRLDERARRRKADEDGPGGNEA